MNGSLDFLNMIKNGAEKSSERSGNVTSHRQVVSHESMMIAKGSNLIDGSENGQTDITVPMSRKSAEMERSKPSGKIAVIDTETNWHDEVMSVGVAIADEKSFKCVDRRYYIIEPECRVGGFFSGVMYKCQDKPFESERDRVLEEVRRYLDGYGVTRIFAYNGKFDVGHLPELADYEWYDIMRLAAYKQFNSAIPASAECCKTGRLKRDYGVEPIMRMLTGNSRYFEVHNAVLDAVDELKIMELLGHEIEMYECARL